MAAHGLLHPWENPWDSPSKNTGVGCHFLLQCMKVKSQSEVAQSCLTRSDPVDHSLPGSSIHGTFQARVLEWASGPVLPVYFWIPFVTVSKMPWCYRQNLLFPLNLHSPPSCEPLQKPGRLVWTLCTLLIAYLNRSWVFPLHIWCLCYHFFSRWLQVSYFPTLSSCSSAVYPPY